MISKREMKRAVLQAPRQLKFEDLDINIEKLGRDQIYAETECSAVSVGTEAAAYLGLPPLRADVTYPRFVGYCNVARVRKVGQETSGIKVDDRIITHQSHQSAFICQAHEVLAVVPQAIASPTASLAYLAQLGLASLQKAQYCPGENVAVLGLGVLGLSTVGVAAALGAQVVAIGNDESRLMKARELGAQTCVRWDDSDIASRIDAATGGVGIDLLITTANSWEAWRTAMEAVRRQGRVAVLGFPGRGEAPPSFNPLDPRWFYGKQLSIFATGAVPELLAPPGDIRFTLHRNMQLVLRLVQDGKLGLERLITHHPPWHELEVIYKLAGAKDKSLIAAVLGWSK